MSKQLQKKFTAFIILLMVFSASIQAQWLTTGTNIYNTNTGKVGIGTSTTTIPSGMLTVKGAGSVPAASWVAAGAPLFTGFGETAIGNADYILSMASTSNNGRPVFVGRRSRGTLALPTVLANNDFIMSMLASGYDGTAFQNPATIDFYVDGTPSAGNVPTRISFVTGSNSGNRAERLKIGSTGNIAFNNTQMYLNNATGNVGIGTNTPTAQLHLGNIVTNRKLVLFDIVNDNNQFYGFGVNSGVLRYQVDATSSSHVFYAGAPAVGSNELMRIQGTGNVGIGTSNPGAKLEVAGQIKMTGGSPGAGKVLTSDTAGLASWQTPSSSSSQWASSGTNINNSNAGNVGIGNSNPTRAKLEVNGVAGTTGGATSAIFGGEGAGISIQRNWPTIGFNQYRDIPTGSGKAIGNGYGMQMNMDPSNGAFSINMQDSVGANQSFGANTAKGITVFKNGFVHVGNNDVSNLATLSISGSTSYPSHFNYGNEGHTYIRGGSNTRTPQGLGGAIPSKVYINDVPGVNNTVFPPIGNLKGGDVVMVTGGGNVGIGVDNPPCPLSFADVIGNKISFYGSATANYGIGVGAGTLQIYTAGQDQIGFGYGSSTSFTQTMTYYPGTAQLGINCAPQTGYNLAVNGKVKAKEILVETGWADYVFADNYKLRSLSEVEDFIKTNKHLPDVTAGDVIEKDGLEVGKTSAQMIKKIEELTLYVIEQEKSINALKEHNLKLESAINSLIEKGGK